MVQLLKKGITYEISGSIGLNLGDTLGEKGPVSMNSATSRYDGPFLGFCFRIVSMLPIYLYSDLNLRFD